MSLGTRHKMQHDATGKSEPDDLPPTQEGVMAALITGSTVTRAFPSLRLSYRMVCRLRDEVPQTFGRVLQG